MVRPAEPGGWVAWWYRSDGDNEILGAGATVEACIRHVRQRQASGLAPMPDEAVVRPHGAARGIRRLVDERDAAAGRRTGRWPQALSQDPANNAGR